MKSSEWKKYVDDDGTVEFPKYIYHTMMDLMKTSLDLGTMVCQDSVKLRAYKEQVKSAYRNRWLELASLLESFGVIEPCVCGEKDFCRVCGGSRYLLNQSLSLQKLEEISYVGPKDDILESKLEEGLRKALIEYRKLVNHGQAKAE